MIAKLTFQVVIIMSVTAKSFFFIMSSHHSLSFCRCCISLSSAYG